MKLQNADQRFPAGLFSVLDAMLNQPLSLILESPNLAPETNNTLLFHEGVYGEVLPCIKADENRAWMNVDCGNPDK